MLAFSEVWGTVNVAIKFTVRVENFGMVPVIPLPFFISMGLVPSARAILSVTVAGDLFISVVSPVRWVFLGSSSAC